MKTAREIHLLSLFILFTACGSFPAAFGMNLSTTGGTAYEGEISSLFQGEVTLQAGQETVKVSRSDLTADSRAALDTWAQDNPHLVDVHATFDTQPTPVRTVSPAKFLIGHNKKETGRVRVVAIIDADGSVIHVVVTKSTNPKLDEASVEAVMNWKFRPAKVAGKDVRAKLRIPLHFD